VQFFVFYALHGVFATVYVSHKFIYLRKITLFTYEFRQIFWYFLYTTVYITEVFFVQGNQYTTNRVSIAIVISW